ncbi:hypothetical protein [Mucilaginibacter lappiensis]|uniref:Cell division protein FtsL n=1 Tax=Mucilaginibacter lappiensis TaxID=354630 RepID=A0A841JQM1_9SPHI|nr:hypothetical protein [Mucilaginibacter lappiensis]MBB6130595.1 cell division protein FtsL [Mucilaginibacter lappiensis]
MKIRKLHLFVLLSLLITAVNTANAQTKVGIKAGVNTSLNSLFYYAMCTGGIACRNRFHNLFTDDLVSLNKLSF